MLCQMQSSKGCTFSIHCTATRGNLPSLQEDSSMLEVQDDRQIALREQLDEKKDQYQQALQTEKDLIMQVIHKYLVSSPPS